MKHGERRERTALKQCIIKVFLSLHSQRRRGGGGRGLGGIVPVAVALFYGGVMQ